jgi:hypothetical protein
MCTVTVLPRARLTTYATAVEPVLLRVACNRDELDRRAAALPPAIHRAGERRVLMPIDPESGGTWIAANDAGLVFALLNSNPGHPAPDGLSRGGIIPRIAGAASVSDALERLIDARTERYRPFRLLVTDRFQLVEGWVEDGRLRYRRAYLHGPVMPTSSSLGDALVEGPRRTLFRRFFQSPAAAVAAQDAFHDHQWPGREDVSVLMRRDGAHTVSQSTIEITPGFATITYRALDARRQWRTLLPLAGGTTVATVRQCS